LETHGPLGTLWVGLGLIAFYIALIWINTLLGFFLTPLFIVPATWLMDKTGLRKRTETRQGAAPEQT
jgi:predicted Na+-dependent transporter